MSSKVRKSDSFSGQVGNGLTLLGKDKHNYLGWLFLIYDNNRQVNRHFLVSIKIMSLDRKLL